MQTQQKKDNSYEFFTDSCANLSDAQIAALDVNIISLNYVIDGVLTPSYVKGAVNNLKPLYDQLRGGKVITTSAINEEQIFDAFTPVLESGKDVLYLSFSSGLSASHEHSVMAANRLQERFPARKIIVVDSLAAACGQGLLAYYAATMRLEGQSIDYVTNWLEENKLCLAHWFTVDSLKYLFRGGRVSRASYLLGTLIQIKPILHVDNAGKLIPVGKVIGRKKSIQVLADKICDTIVEPEKQFIFISHGDCINEVEILKERITSRINIRGFVSNILDTVIGSHSGPGTLAAFALCEKR